MKFVKLPIKVSKYDQEELDQFDSLGLGYPEDMAVDDFMKVNVLHIVDYIEVNGVMDVELTSGTRLGVQMSEKEFEDLIND